MVMLQDHLWPEGERNRIYSSKKPSNEGFFFIFTDCLNVLNSRGFLQYKRLLIIMIKINNKIFSILISRCKIFFGFIECKRKTASAISVIIPNIFFSGTIFCCDVVVLDEV